MPCKVDLFEGYKWYDQYDLADHMYYNTPLVPLMCEILELINNRGMLDECSEIVQKWYKYHEEDDYIRNNSGKRINWTNRRSELEPFIEHMNKIGFTAITGILTPLDKEQRLREKEKCDQEHAEWKKQEDIKRDEEQKSKERENRARQKSIEQAVLTTIGRTLKEDEQHRLRSEYITYPYQSGMWEVFYLDEKRYSGYLLRSK